MTLPATQDHHAAPPAKRPRVRRPPAVASETLALVGAIERAIRDPDVDVDKMRQLFGMATEVRNAEAERAYNTALTAAQHAMAPIAADQENTQTRSRYASYAQLDRACRPIFTAHGFSLSFGTAEGAPPEHVRVTCRIAHAGGHKELVHVDMPADGKGAKGGDVMTRTHAAGAAMSYGQRYLLKLIFNLAVGDDTDGNTNGGRDMSEAAKKAIETLNGHKTAAEHVLWKKEQAAGVEKMVDPAEWREIVALWNRRAKALKQAAAQ